VAPKSPNLTFGPFRLEPGNAQLWRGDERVALPPKPFDVLCHLAERPGKLVTKDQLLDAVWPNLHISESSLNVAINALRSALGDDSKAPHYIETVPRRGYRFVAPVVAEGTEHSPPPWLALAQPHLWVGRTGQIAELDDSFQRAAGQRRQLVFVTGEAGIGKTTLVEMFLERKFQHGVRILLGRCVEHFGTDEAFLPLIDALQDYCAGSPSLLQTLRDCAPTWLVQLTGLIGDEERQELQKEVFGATRERMLREYCELLEALGAKGPVVVVVDDLHWSDYATLDLLSRFARRTKNASVLVIATYRPADAAIANHPSRRLHLDLQRQGLCGELQVERFSQTEVEEYLALRFRDVRIGRELAQRIYSRSEGQALFVVSLADDLIARKEIVEVEGRWRVSERIGVAQSSVSEGLREIIGGQIDRLTAGEQRLLEAASVAGVEFSAAMLSRPTSEDICGVEEICEALARKGLILSASGVTEWPNGTVSGRYAFLHSLYQEVLYQRLAPAQRARLHREIGERLEAGSGDRAADIAAILAVHFEEGRDISKAVHYLAQAAKNSSQRFSNGEAAIYLTRALNLVKRLPANQQTATRIMLLHQKAWARRSGGDFPGSEEDLQTMVSCAAEAGELRAEINGLLDLSRFCLYSDRRQSLQIAERALAKSQHVKDDILRALARGSNANINLMLRGWRDEDAELCREVVKTTAEALDPWISLRRCSFDTVTNYLNSNYLESCVAAREGKQHAQAIGDEYYFVLFNTIIAFALLHLGEWRELRQTVSAALAMTEKNANTQGSVLCHLTLGWLHAEALDFECARKCCEEALNAEVEANPFTFFIGRNLMAKACIGLRDYPGALAQFHEIQDRIDADGVGMDYTICQHFYSNFCQYWLETGDLARAHKEAARLYEISALPPERTYLALSHSLLAKIAMAEKKFDEAKAHVLRAVSIVERANLPLAAWRVYATAAILYDGIGEQAEAAAARRLSRQVIDSLCQSLSQDEPLRTTLISRYPAEALR
jgi:DNA-binding winged helix-turn-helix (wHTH) protein/tetratricopeptide (TPR) repeat protein